MDDNISSISDYILIDHTNGQYGELDFSYQTYTFPASKDQSKSESDSFENSCEMTNDIEHRLDTNIRELQLSLSAEPLGYSEPQADDEISTEDEADLGIEEEDGEESCSTDDKSNPRLEDEDETPRSDDKLLKAVRDDSLHIVDWLLEESSPPIIYSALMLSISLDRRNMTIKIINKKYGELHHLIFLASIGAIDRYHGNVSDGAEDGQRACIPSTYRTPLMLAAVKNQFEIVRLIITKGERITEPHAIECVCNLCLEQSDAVQKAKLRLFRYQALCSDSYVITASTDPIYRAFELGSKMRKTADQEKYYKAQYNDLLEQVGGLSGRILDKVCSGDELDTILNEKRGSGLKKYTNLARLKLAVSYKEKQFVAHAACQKKLATLWLGEVNPSFIKSLVRSMLFMLLLAVCYPVLGIAYWIYPKGKLAKFVECPIVKFAANTLSYVAFVILVVALSLLEKVSTGFYISEDPDIGHHYPRYINQTQHVFSDKHHIRVHSIMISTILLCVWVFGLAFEIAKKLVTDGLAFFTDNSFNILNFVQVLLYLISFGLRFSAIFHVYSAIKYFSRNEAWRAVVRNDSTALAHAYWITAERARWSSDDPTIISEAVFAVGSVLTICKIIYAFIAIERIGPLVLSIGEMLKDVLAFMMLFFFVIAAFCVGFHNVYWYLYDGISYDVGESPPSQFESIHDVIELFFWSIFGLGKFDAASTFSTSLNNPGISLTGNIIFAVYNWVMVIILINILIAMMAKSYTKISEREDMEWKFARTKLFLEYMRQGSTLPPPLNILPNWKDAIWLGRKCTSDWCYRMACRKPPHEQQETVNGNSKTLVRNSETLDNNRQGKVEFLPKKGEEPSLAYTKVMVRVIKRLKDCHSKENQSQSAGRQVLQDMSNLRQAVMMHILRQVKQRAVMMESIKHLNNHVIKARKDSTRHHAHLKAINDERFRDLDSRIKDVEAHVNASFQNTLDVLQDVQKCVGTQFRDMRTDVTKAVQSLTSRLDDMNSTVAQHETRVMSMEQLAQEHSLAMLAAKGKLQGLMQDVVLLNEAIQTEMEFSD